MVDSARPFKTASKNPYRQSLEGETKDDLDHAALDPAPPGHGIVASRVGGLDDQLGDALPSGPGGLPHGLQRPVASQYAR